MPPRTVARPALRPPDIRGQVLHSYRVTTLEDVDRYLVGLKRWLSASIDRAPAETLSFIERYNADADLLLDARLALMGLAYAS